MKTVIMWQTMDGVLHDCEQKAHSHANRRYGDALTSLAHDLVRNAEKYRAIVDWLDDAANLDRFLALRRLRDDCTLPGDNEDA